jgi:hypothetical protein
MPQLPYSLIPQMGQYDLEYVLQSQLKFSITIFLAACLPLNTVQWDAVIILLFLPLLVLQKVEHGIFLP